MTLRRLRPIIQYDRSGHMDKRSMMFQEATFVMSRLPNHYKRARCELQMYQFGKCFLNFEGFCLSLLFTLKITFLGFFHRKTKELILIETENEDKPIADLIGAIDFFAYDLAIVPLSQIPPDIDQIHTVDR